MRIGSNAKKLVVLLLLGMASLDDYALAVSIQNNQKAQSKGTSSTDNSLIKVLPKLSHQLGSKGLNELVQTQDMKESPIIKKLNHVKTKGVAELDSLKPSLSQTAPTEENSSQLSDIMSQVLNKYKNTDTQPSPKVAAVQAPVPQQQVFEDGPPSSSSFAIQEDSKPAMEDNEQDSMKTGTQKFEKKDKEQIEIVAEGGMDLKTTAGETMDLDSD